MEITDLTLTEASGRIANQKISPVELVRACLSRIERLDSTLNSFITLAGESALEAAKRAEQEIRTGSIRSSLHGIPLALKDLYETSDMPTTAGSRFFKDYLPQEDSFVVQKLMADGALILGKLNMHEIALGVTNVNPHFGACRNPWGMLRISGGSSGGSAVALAARLIYGSLGTDTGGSIRIPASLCGIVGLKPTYGRVSLRGVIPLSWNLDHAGPMGRCVEDVALLLQAIAGYDVHDPYCVDVPVDDYLGRLMDGVKGWRVALAGDAYFSEVSDLEVVEAVQAAARVFESLGAQVEQVDFPQARQAARANGLMTPADAAAYHQERLATHPEMFGADIRQRLEIGAAYTSSEYILARRTQSLLRYEYTRFFQGYDILLTPTTPVAAPLIEGPDAVEQARLLTRFTAPFNLTGLPALSLPCGFTRLGLPIGLQIVSRPWAEALVLQAAYAYEQATDWYKRVPAEPFRGGV
jgi:aspartyl-tRNA(Asn)/glutamyl-tRNA(Gln) amidotransferase subunit A